LSFKPNKCAFIRFQASDRVWLKRACVQTTSGTEHRQMHDDYTSSKMMQHTNLATARLEVADSGKSCFFSASACLLTSRLRSWVLRPPWAFLALHLFAADFPPGTRERAGRWGRTATIFACKHLRRMNKGVKKCPAALRRSWAPPNRARPTRNDRNGSHCRGLLGLENEQGSWH
jgi:hypothetical protein